MSLDTAPRGFYVSCRIFQRRALAALCLLAAAFAVAAPREALAQGAGGSPDIRISQIYSRGGEAGSAFQSDFVELFNRGTASVDINGWAIQVTGFEGNQNAALIFSFTSSRGIVMEPGKHMLFEFARGTEGQPLPTPDFPIVFFTPNISGTGAFVALFRKAPDPPSAFCPSSHPDLVDLVGFGTSTCRETASAPAPPATQALLRKEGGGCTDNNHNSEDFRLGPPNPRNSFAPAESCTGPSSFIDVELPQYDAAESDGRFAVKVKRTGDTSTPASVEYFAHGGTASDRQDYTTALGTLRFAPGETEKTVDVLLTDDAYPESNETLGFDLTNVKGAAIGVRGSALLVIHDNDSGPPASNPADNTAFFVRQHYHDFLNREPDEGGWQFWINNIESCGADEQCRAVKRIDTSAAFFLSIEFQQTGFLVHRTYRAAFPAGANRPQGPRMLEFLRDTQALGRGVAVGTPGWELALEANTRAYFDEFVTRPEFTAVFPTFAPATHYVDLLNANTGGSLTQQQRDALVAALNSGAKTRAGVLREVAENPVFTEAEKNRAFVLMQYIGYLRRNPDDSPDTDFRGFQFWLDKLNFFGGDWRQAQMVFAFIDSIEYRQRFAP